MPHRPRVYCRILRASGLCLSSRMTARVGVSKVTALSKAQVHCSVSWRNRAISDAFRHFVCEAILLEGSGAARCR
jgi:hypothetical protein